MTELTTSERFLLDWLSRKDVSQMGECQGKDLDRLVELGFAETKPSKMSSTHGQEYNLVRLTTQGRHHHESLLDPNSQL